MPIRLNATELAPGMVLHDPVRRGSTTLLGCGHTLNAGSISTITARYPNLVIRVRTKADGIHGIFDDDRTDRITLDNALDRISECVAEAFENAANPTERVADFGRIERQVTSVISYLTAHPVLHLALAPDLSGVELLHLHVARTFVTAVALAVRMQQYVVTERQRQSSSTNLPQQLAAALLPLGLGVMYMDLGMLDLQDLVERVDPLTPLDRARIQKHTVTSLANTPPQMSAAGRAIVRWHHEGMDQCGYPDRPPGVRLHVLTRLVRVADAFAAATSPRAFRPAKSGARALWEICRGLEHQQFDPLIANGLASLAQPFSSGTRVRLNNGTHGIVSARTSNPFRPRIFVTSDASGMSAITHDECATVDLAQDASLHIVTADGEDVTDLRQGMLAADTSRRVA